MNNLILSNARHNIAQGCVIPAIDILIINYPKDDYLIMFKCQCKLNEKNFINGIIKKKKFEKNLYKIIYNLLNYMQILEGLN